MKRFFFLAVGLLFTLQSCTQPIQPFNGSFEHLDSNHMPSGWHVTFTREVDKAYPILLDSAVVKDGKYSLSITKKAEGAEFGAISMHIPAKYKAGTIELKGFLKTQDVTGFAGLWLRVDGSNGILAFDNMQKMNIKGTNDWKEYTITLPYNDEDAETILVGGLLAGGGKIWIDDFKVYFDGKPIDKAELKTGKKPNAQTDTTFAKRSGIDTVLMTNHQQLTNLTLLAQVWGFIKYHHPAAANGSYDMDAELFRVLPRVIAAKNNSELSYALETWIDKFGKPALCKSCKVDSTNIYQKPDYGSIFNDKILTPALTAKLIYILDNRNTEDNYYIRMQTGIGNPNFGHEKAYRYMDYPDAGYRLLSLFRYWNIIQYFFPYKHLIGTDWDKALPEYIPQFVSASNKTEYVLTVLKMISSIHDTHANVWGSNLTLEAYRGLNTLPVQAKFIEGKLVVTAFYMDNADIKQALRVGDIISSIDGQKVDDLIKKYLPITSASNYSTQLRDMPQYYLLRTNKQLMRLDIVRDGQTQHVETKTVELKRLAGIQGYSLEAKIEPYKVIDGQIGYIYPGKYKNQDLPQIKQLFKNTRGIIVDMRCYPSEFMPFTFVPYIKTGNSPFVYFTKGSISDPGLFRTGGPLSTPGIGGYKGKVIVIVNEQTQSQAEYTTMAFQSSSNVTVIGSTTAGADGDVSKIVLPGDINTLISGIEVLYPDGTTTQRKGVKIDYVITPTIAGVKAGRDELLEKAIEMINK